MLSAESLEPYPVVQFLSPPGPSDLQHFYRKSRLKSEGFARICLAPHEE